MFYKSKDKKLNFVDLKLLHQELHSAVNEMGLAASSSFQNMKACEIKESQASLCDKFDYDAINNSVVTFLSTNTCYIIPDLADFESTCYGT